MGMELGRVKCCSTMFLVDVLTIETKERLCR